MTVGLVLGKFMPLHKGHEYLLNFAAQQVDELWVMVCGLEREPIPLQHRVTWVRESVDGLPNVRVVEYGEDIQQEPKGKFDTDFWLQWLDAIYSVTDNAMIDYVFTSEQYGFKLAGWLNAKHVPCNMRRDVVPISGTDIRNNPLAHWEYISEAARPYFVKRITIGGPESTGKSTLSQKLARRMRTVYVPEYGRDFLEQRRDFDFTFDDLEHICRGHLASTEAMAKQANKMMFIDTDPIITHLYGQIYWEATPSNVVQAMMDWQSDLTLVTMPTCEFVQDGTRELGNMREKVVEDYIGKLELLGRNYRLIDASDWEEREEQAMQYIREFLYG